MFEYKLARLRYANSFKFFALVDFFTEVTIWIIGALVEDSELNQIIKYHFTESIFDILILSSFKALILFVLINELEQTYLIIATTKSNKQQQQQQQQPSTTENGGVDDPHSPLINNNNNYGGLG